MTGYQDPNYPGVAPYPMVPPNAPMAYPQTALQDPETTPTPIPTAPPTAPPQGSQASTALQPAGTMSQMSVPYQIGAAAREGTQAIGSAIGAVTSAGGQSEADISAAQQESAQAAGQAIGGAGKEFIAGASGQPSPSETSSQEAARRGVPVQQVIQERMAASPPAEAPSPVTDTNVPQPKQTAVGGAAVTTPTPTTAVSEPPTAAPPPSPYSARDPVTGEPIARLKGARGDQPSGIAGDNDRDGYPDATPRVLQNPTRYNQLGQSKSAEDQSLFNLVNGAAKAQNISPVALFNMMYAQSGSTDDGKIKIDQSNLMGLTSQEMNTLDPEGHFSHDPSNLVANIALGAAKMHQLQGQFGNSVASSIAAYKYGADRVNAASRRATAPADPVTGEPDDQEKALPGFRDFVDLASGNAPVKPATAVPSTAPAPAATPVSAPAAPSGDEGAPVPTAAPAPTTPAQPGAPAGQAGPAGQPGPAPAPAAQPGAAPAQPGAAPAPAPAPAQPGGLPPRVQRGYPIPPMPTVPPGLPAPGVLPPGAPPIPGMQPYSSPDATPHVLTGNGSMTPTGLVTAARGGPQSYMTYMVNNAPSGMNTTDMWQHSANLLAAAFIRSGDMVGAQRAQEYVFQQAHVGATQSLMQAYSAMSGGDLTSAAQLLAKAHTFFPDGTAGGFQVINGQIWGERFDEHTGQPMGQPFQVTPASIRTALNQTIDPQKYLTTLREEQQQVETQRHNMVGEYLESRGQNITQQGQILTAQGAEEGRDVTQRGQDITYQDVQARIAETRQRAEELNQYRQSQIEAQNARKLAQLQEQEANRAQRLELAVAGQEQVRQARVKQVDDTINSYYGPNNLQMQDATSAYAQSAPVASNYMKGIMQSDPGMNGVTAHDLATGLMPSTDQSGQQQPSRYRPMMMPDGYTHIIDRTTGEQKAYLPTTLAQHYGIVTAPPQQQQAPQGRPGPQQIPPGQMRPPQGAMPATAISPPS